MLKIKIGGVPEHFNLPWNLAIEDGSFNEKGIDVEWIEYPGGTGAMCADLRNESLDMAVLLTEGICADIANGNPSKIVKWFVKSPLNWGIHVPYKSQIKNVDDLKGKKYAISRKGSGSHLMAYVDASIRKWKLKEDQFLTVGNLNGAIDALNRGEAEIFMWEKLMTKSYVDNDTLRRIDVRPTPWPCFAIACRTEFLQKNKHAIANLFNIINGFENRMRQPDVNKILENKYLFKSDDVATWLHETKWSEDNVIGENELQKVMDELYKLSIINSPIPVADITSELT